MAQAVFGDALLSSVVGRPVFQEGSYYSRSPVHLNKLAILSSHVLSVRHVDHVQGAWVFHGESPSLNHSWAIMHSHMLAGLEMTTTLAAGQDQKAVSG